MTETLRVVVEGRVQGVGYREFVRRAAARLHVTGWVRNRADGAVEAVLSGGAEEIEGLLREMRAGPPLSEVTDVQARPVPAEDHPAFRVLRGD
jgi:acylphosphatase